MGPICGLGVEPTAAERPNLARRIREAPIEQAEPPPHRRLSPHNQSAILPVELTPPAIAGVGHGACPTGAGGPLFPPGWLPSWWENSPMRALSGSFFRHDKSPTSTGSVEDPAASRQLNSRYGQNAWTYPRIWSGQVQSARDVRRSIFSLPAMLGNEAWTRSLAASDFSAGADTFGRARRAREDAARYHARRNIARGEPDAAAVTPRSST